MNIQIYVNHQYNLLTSKSPIFLFSCFLFVIFLFYHRDMFSSEMQSGQIVRLIANGQLLSEESRTLSSYGINNQQVIHCQISQASAHTQQGHQTVDTGDGEFDLGRYMVPLFACILAFMWYLRFQYRYMFNATSTLSLTAVTAVFFLALMAVWRT